MSKHCYPTDFFPKELVDQTYSFINSLTGDEIKQYRHSYKRELNNSHDENQLPEPTVDKRRCFLYLTAQYG